MNQKEAQGVVRNIEVVKAFAEGKAIQCRGKEYPEGHWYKTDDPKWLSDTDYRIKPEPVLVNVAMFRHPKGENVQPIQEKFFDLYVENGWTRCSGLYVLEVKEGVK
jgi:hypothetical protein